MRELKFRGWDGKNMLVPEDLSVSPSRREWLGKYDADLMQYTGLKDKNGVEIYESDVIHVPYNRIDDQEVIFLPSGTWSCSAFDLAQCKVIGNIHQNPELLK